MAKNGSLQDPVNHVTDLSRTFTSVDGLFMAGRGQSGDDPMGCLR